MPIPTPVRQLLLISSITLFALAGCGGGSDGGNTDTLAASDAVAPATQNATATSPTNAPAEVTPAEANGDTTPAADTSPQVQPDLEPTGVAGIAVLPTPSKPSPGTPTQDALPDSSGSDALDKNGNGSKTGDVVAILAGSPGPDTEEIRGFWDFSTTEGPLDILYEAIGSDGRITYFDWDDDDYGSGRNCFIVETRSFSALGNDQYSFDGTVLNMAVVAGLLHVSELGGAIQKFPPRMTIDTAMLPRCE